MPSYTSSVPLLVVQYRLTAFMSVPSDPFGHIPGVGHEHMHVVVSHLIVDNSFISCSNFPVFRSQ